MPEPPIIVWLRQDLRVADHPALAAAAASGRPVVPLYVLDDETPGKWKMGEASRWWLHGSLTALAATLDTLGTQLVLRRGRCDQVIPALAARLGASVFWNRHHEPFWHDVEARIAAALTASGLEHRTFAGSLLHEPGSIRGRHGDPLKVFTPFWKACLAAGGPPAPQPAPSALRSPAVSVAGDRLNDWRLQPITPDWAGGMRATWTPGESAAKHRLTTFVDGPLAAYHELRDRPEPAATSMLSPHLHFGELSAGQVWHAVSHAADTEPRRAAAAASFLRELGWREFCAHTLVNRPQLPDTPLQERFARFPWSVRPELVSAWRLGRTGYPIVDAGMRQLWATGWMHNRVRMIVASFLVKHLLIPWQIGESWFWDTLVDADLANNAGGWQWVAGCGTDAAPYFRIFNPVLQGERFDPDGAYVRRWVPELAAMPSRWIHRPWEAPSLERAAVGIRIGDEETYPRPIIDHGAARARALAAFSALPK